MSSSRIGKAPLGTDLQVAITITVVPPFRNMVRRFDPSPSIRPPDTLLTLINSAEDCGNSAGMQ